jgi:hypothetical protein
MITARNGVIFLLQNAFDSGSDVTLRFFLTTDRAATRVKLLHTTSEKHRRGTVFQVFAMEDEIEKNGGYGNTTTVTPHHVYNEDVQIVDEHERKDLVRGLKQRHVQMIAIAGAIVSCLFSFI